MLDKCLSKLIVVSTDQQAAYRYCTNYLKVPSTEIEVMTTEEQINDVDDYRVMVSVPYILDGMGVLNKACFLNKNIELLTQDQVVMVGQILARIIRETFEALPLQSYPASVLKDFIQQRLHSNLGTMFTFDFNFNNRNGNIEMVPLNQPTAAYLIMSRRYISGV